MTMPRGGGGGATLEHIFTCMLSYSELCSNILNLAYDGPALRACRMVGSACLKDCLLRPLGRRLSQQTGVEDLAED